VPLSGAALTQFHAEGSALMLGNYLTSPSCSTFFTGTPLGANYLDPVSLAVIEQVPYDAVQSNISMYDAGMSDGKIPLTRASRRIRRFAETSWLGTTSTAHTASRNYVRRIPNLRAPACKRPGHRHLHQHSSQWPRAANSRDHPSRGSAQPDWAL